MTRREGENANRAGMRWSAYYLVLDEGMLTCYNMRNNITF